jgi:acyl carrier protein
LNAADQERLQALIAEILGMDRDDLTPGTDFVEDLNLDRNDLGDLFVAVEDAFGVSLEDGMRDVHTVDDLEALVDDLIPA